MRTPYAQGLKREGGPMPPIPAPPPGSAAYGMRACCGWPSRTKQKGVATWSPHPGESQASGDADADRRGWPPVSLDL